MARIKTSGTVQLKNHAENDEAISPRRRRGRGSTAVYEDLREDILSLRIAPGSALDELALAERFGLSRTPIRESLLMLAGEDLVTFLPGRSAIVTPHTLSNTHEYMDTLMILSRAVARLAAETRPPTALVSIDASRRVYETAVQSGDTEAIVKGDLAFHRAVSQASGNKFLGNFYSLSLDYGRRMNLLHYYPTLSEEDRQKSIEAHAALSAAIERGQGEEADRAARDHVLMELRTVQRSLEPRIGSSFSLGILKESRQ